MTTKTTVMGLDLMTITIITRIMAKETFVGATSQEVTKMTPSEEGILMMMVGMATWSTSTLRDAGVKDVPMVPPGARGGIACIPVAMQTAACNDRCAREMKTLLGSTMKATCGATF